MKEEVIQITTGARSFALALGVAVVFSTNNFRPRIDDLAHLAHSRSRCSVLLRFNIFGIVDTDSGVEQLFSTGHSHILIERKFHYDFL